MKSVWVVTQGQYSDYRIVAVFETEAEAKQFTNGFEGADGEHINLDEWSLGPPKEGEFFQVTYGAHIAMSDGHLLAYRNLHGMIIEIEECIQMHPRDWSEGKAGVTFWCHENGKHVSIDAAGGRSVVSSDHALKVAVEARQAELRKATEVAVR